ncbi:hypothetical protein [Leptospira levettii]|uniref:hypothetical protein n=1 Tax=Leptospira levettii TaxID=2023178 RepID=UPI00108463F2|nr:hypothetical protein [Leptospira levettii]TGL11607.1 hypothetical protein EHQ39_05115 [Leptospira levettii]
MKYLKTVLFLNSLLLSLTIEANDQSDAIMTREDIFIQVNKNKNVSVKVKFLFSGTISDSIFFPETEFFPLKSFKIAWNEKKINSKIISATNSKFLLVNKEFYPKLFESKIPKNSKLHHNLEINYQYYAPYWRKGSKINFNNGHYYEYILTTGATWKDKIGIINILIKFDFLQCSDVIFLDDSFLLDCENNSLSGSFKNIEPDHNIRFLVKDI